VACWNHPERGIINAPEFVPIAEDIGIVARIGWLVLERAVQVAMAWDANHNLSVNISPHQFRDPDLAHRISEIFDAAGYDPLWIEVELTESAITSDYESAGNAIRMLQDRGISIALDHFGTGFSSLSNLRRLPFDRLKTDRSFVTNIGGEPGNQQIAAGILALARRLGLSVTAEGVESDTDLTVYTSSIVRWVRDTSSTGRWTRPARAPQSATNGHNLSASQTCRKGQSSAARRPRPARIPAKWVRPGDFGPVAAEKPV